MYIGGVTFKELFTDRQYKIMLMDSGIFGFITPIFNHHLRHKKRNPGQNKIVVPSNKQELNISL